MDPIAQALKFQQEGKLNEAKELFLSILRVDPTNAVSLFSLALILSNQGIPHEAMRYSKLGVETNPKFAPLWNVHAHVLQNTGQFHEAIAAYEQAIQLDPNLIDAHVNKGVAQRAAYLHVEALKSFENVLALNPNHEIALNNIGTLLMEFNQHERATEMFARLRVVNPKHPYVTGNLVYARLNICDWTDLDALQAEIINNITLGQQASKTLGFMAISDSAASHYACAKIFAKNYFPAVSKQYWRGETYSHDRIRVAYISPDFREHPVGHLMVSILEHHDKSKFEIFAISLGINDNSPLRSRFEKAADHFIDVKGRPSVEIAELIRNLEIDLAIDLAGYTAESRSEIFAMRPAPKQVNYLGYPGTMANEAYDYIIADRTIIPDHHADSYSEKVIYLDRCYLPFPHGIDMSYKSERSVHHLPDDAFVFCAFCYDFKIHPRIFSIWMRLLNETPGSVLWLMSRNQKSKENLLHYAKEQGVDISRIIFAERVPKIEDHLARYQLADLFLDTWPYNAHTTAADALVAGLPVLTYEGDAFPSRVAASLLRTLGVEALVATSFDDYFAKARHFAHDRGALATVRADIKSKFENSDRQSALSFARSLETAFIKIHHDHGRDGSNDVTQPRAVQSSGAEQISDSIQAQKVGEVGSLAVVQSHLDQHNYPLAEIYIRRYLKESPRSQEGHALLERILGGYGLTPADQFPQMSGRLGLPKTKFHIIKAWGFGFWSEVHHVLGQLLVAELTERTPIVHWGRNFIFRKPYDVNAFIRYFEPVSDALLPGGIANCTYYPHKWNSQNIGMEDLNKWSGDGSRLSAAYFLKREEDYTVSDFFAPVASLIPYIAPSSVYFGLQASEIYQVLFAKYIHFSTHLVEMAKLIYQTHMARDKWVAVHMRGSDKIKETPHLNAINDSYVAIIDQYLTVDPNLRIFLLTDDKTCLEKMMSRYGKKIFHTDFERNDGTSGTHYTTQDPVGSAEEVIVETLLATECDYFVGNRETNVSLAISGLKYWANGHMVLLGTTDMRGENEFIYRR